MDGYRNNPPDAWTMRYRSFRAEADAESDAWVPSPPSQRPLGCLAAVGVLVAWGVGLVLGALMGQAVFRNTVTIQFVAMGVVGVVATAGAAAVLALHGRDLHTLGLRPKDFTRQFGRAVKYEIVGFFGVLGIMGLIYALGFRSDETSVLDHLLGRDILTVMTVFFLATVVTPVYEELTFRGIFQAVFRRWFGRTAGIGLSALLFGLFHGGWRIPGMVFFGVLLALARVRSRTLALPILIHMLHNGIVMAFAIGHHHL